MGCHLGLKGWQWWSSLKRSRACMISGVALSACDCWQGLAKVPWQLESGGLDWTGHLSYPTLDPSHCPSSKFTQHFTPWASHPAEGLHTRPCSVVYQTGRAWEACLPNSEWTRDKGSHLRGQGGGHLVSSTLGGCPRERTAGKEVSGS